MVGAMSDPIVAAAAALRPLLADHADAHDRDRALAAPVVDAIRDAGLLRLLLPRALDGLAVAPPVYVDALIELAAADGATAWVVMTASTSTLLAGYLDRDLATAIWRDQPLLAGVFAPNGRVVTDGADARVTGRWAWASGCRHASWVLVGALAEGRHVVVATPTTAPGVAVVDTWDPIGLRGTGSHDLTFTDVAVPAAALTSVFDRAPWCDEPLTRVPLFGLLAVGVAAVGLGLARGALDHVAAAATAAGKDGGALMAGYADALARWRAARGFLVEAGALAYADALTGPVDPRRRGELRLAALHAAREAAALVATLFTLGGGGAVPRRSPLARALADVQVMRTHRMVSDRIGPAAARAALGVGPVPPEL